MLTKLKQEPIFQKIGLSVNMVHVSGQFLRMPKCLDEQFVCTILLDYINKLAYN